MCVCNEDVCVLVIEYFVIGFEKDGMIDVMVVVMLNGESDLMCCFWMLDFFN